MEVQESSSSDDGSTQGSIEWLSARIFCRCTRCKHQIKRQRRIAMQHMQEYGEMQRDDLHIPTDGSQVSGINENLICVNYVFDDPINHNSCLLYHYL